MLLKYISLLTMAAEIIQDDTLFVANFTASVTKGKILQSLFNTDLIITHHFVSKIQSITEQTLPKKLIQC